MDCWRLHWETVNKQNVERCVGFGTTSCLRLGSIHEQRNMNVMCLGCVFFTAA